MSETCMRSELSPVKLPRPGERLNEYSITVTADEAVILLEAQGMSLYVLGCEPGVPCASCETVRRVWWDVFMALGLVDQERIEFALALGGLPLPPRPASEPVA